jgi:hypothetical protein
MMRTVILPLCLAVGAPTARLVAHAQAPQASSPAAASTTRLMRFAGGLIDAAGEPLAGPQSVTFTLFDQPQGGTALWTETLTVAADDRGRFVVNLGSSTPLPQDVFTDEQARWIGTAIDGRDLGRTALVAVPYALKAADADTLGGHAAATYVRARGDGRLETSAGLLSGPAVDGVGVAGQIAKWAGSTTLGSSVISESASNRIGFGLTDPTGGGVVDSVFTIRNYDNNTGFGILNETQQRRFAINTLASGGWQMYDGGNTTWNAGIAQWKGNIGLGTSNPQRLLQVGPGVDAMFTVEGSDASPNAGYIRFGDQTGWKLYFGRSRESSGGALNTGTTGILMTLRDDGTVGIGTRFPAAKLNVDVGAGSTDALRARAVYGGALVLEGLGCCTRNLAEGVVNGSTPVFHITTFGTYVAGSDFAEALPVRGDKRDYEPGDVLVISTESPGAVEKASRPYDPRVAGVYSTRPAMLGADKGGVSRIDAEDVPIAIVGIVPTKATTENGPIQVGDLLTTSSTPGHAMKASPVSIGAAQLYPTGTIVGKALESLPDGSGVIKVLVTLK